MLEENRGPALRVVSTYPADGDGFDCSFDDPTCGVPIDAAVEIRFDRYLLPSTATRQSFFLYSGDPSNMVPPGDQLPALTPVYDVIERVVSYSLPAGVFLQPNTHYTAELVVPHDDDDLGFRAFDAAPLAADTTVRLSFLTSNQRTTPGSEDPPGTCFGMVRTMNDHCDSAGCHTTKEANGEPATLGAMMGLDLSDANGLVLTAIGRVAHQTETGPATGTPLQNPDRFGVAMPRIDPGRPDNSYLMYKLVVSPENYFRQSDTPDLCRTSHRAAVDPVACVPATADENERLRAWFLRGVGMPRAVEENPPIWLVRSELRLVESWIRAGAPCP